MEGTPGIEEREVLRDVSGLWWVWLVIGIAWLIAALVILQFDQASVTTVGVIIGIMFWGAGIQNFAVASVVSRMKWLYWTFGALFIAAGVLAFISPENTFAAIADILGFLFFLVGAFWIIQAFVAREISELWWLGLVSGILMVILAFWTGGQFFIDKAYVLLVFAGIWALMQGVTDIVRAFQIRKLHELV
ncbi:MAG: HdeD family acid-resistance protein [Solirubrobacterales bacterium]